MYTSPEKEAKSRRSTIPASANAKASPAAGDVRYHHPDWVGASTTPKKVLKVQTRQRLSSTSLTTVPLASNGYESDDQSLLLY